MKIVIHLLSLSGPDGWQTVSDLGLPQARGRRALTAQELALLRDGGPSLFGDEDDAELSREVDNELLDTIVQAAAGEDEQGAARAARLRLAHDAFLRSVPGGTQDEDFRVDDEEAAWRDERVDDLGADGDTLRSLRDAPERRREAGPLCSDCAERLREAQAAAAGAAGDGPFAGGARLLAPLRGTIGNLDGWCLEVDPDRVVLRDLHSDLCLEFRRLGGQWVFDSSGLR